LTPGADPKGRSLVEVLLDEAEGPGSLPLLEYTLDELVRQLDRDRQLSHEAPEGRTLSWHAYEELGGLTGAIGRRVDAELKKLGGIALHRPGLDALIRSLTQIDHQSREPMARQALLDDLAGIHPGLIELMIHLRLVVLDGTIMRVAHEALLTKWSVARETIERDADALLLRDALERQSARWQVSPPAEKRGYLLPVGGQLTEAVDLLRRCQQELPWQIVSFIEASQEQHQREIRIAEARLVADDQRSLDHISAGEFQQAELKLQEITAYLRSHIEPELASREAEFSERLARVRRLAGFYAAAREADTLAGEEDFDKALPKCREALQHLDIDDLGWWDKLPTQDIAVYPTLVRDLEQESYRTLLRYSGLQLVPGINLLWPGRAPVTPVRRRLINLKTLAGLILPFLLPIVGPSLLPIIAKRGGFWRFRLLGRQDRKEALVEFEKIRVTLAKIREVEKRLAMYNEDGSSWSSRTSQFIHRLVDFFVELASPPKDAPIDYRQWLQGNWDGSPQEPINAVDYFFIGLLNYFVAKRRETVIPKALALVRGQFPYIDGRTPLATANRLLRTAVALDPKNFWAHWVLGRTLLTAKDYAGAELAFHAAVALRPSYARSYEQRALAIAHQWVESKDDRLRRRALKDSEDTRKKFANGDPSIFGLAASSSSGSAICGRRSTLMRDGWNWRRISHL
jgi:tetratricopeptide (TPR) repeat protein